MISKKKTGSYYTPNFLAEFVTSYVSKEFKNVVKVNVFEPSVGDGSFVRAFTKTSFPRNVNSFSLVAIDKVDSELQKAQLESSSNSKPNCEYSFLNADFLEYQKNAIKKFQLIIGNPPYIKKQLLSERQIAICQEIRDSANLAKHSIKNIWTAFLVRCCQMLDENGILAFVLPAELLQVKFAEELRLYLTQCFVRVEIFTFDDLLFECKGQDTILVIGFKIHDSSGLFYANISDIAQLTSGDFTLKENCALHETGFKWKHHFLEPQEIKFIYNLGERLNTINHYCESKPGIVTAANDFFIVNKDTEKEYNLSKHCIPIIQKGSYVNGRILYSNQDYEKLVADNLPSKIIAFSDRSTTSYHKKTKLYIEQGVVRKLSERYKCKIRKNWFVVPNISTSPQAFFFKRSHQYPKLLRNDANVHVTDSAYKVDMKDNYKIDSMLFSFYNSLTLAFTELLGRGYGGGVLELTPSEFKSIPIPYCEVSEGEFEEFVNLFEGKKEIIDITKANDYIILNKVLGLSTQEINLVHSIYQKLVSKRLG